jgi:hypothetical protein
MGIVEETGLHPAVALKLWTTPRARTGDAGELSALERTMDVRHSIPTVMEVA